MFTKTRILLSLIFLIACTVVNAQDQIERLFRGDRENIGIDVIQTPDNGFLFLTAGRPFDSTRYEYYTVSKFDEKTNFEWSKDYSFEQKVIPDGSLMLLEGDSFLLSGILDTGSVNRVLLKGAPGGDVVWTRGYGRDDNVDPFVLGDAIIDEAAYDNRVLMAGSVYDNAFNNNVYLTQLDADGNQFWGKVYNDPNTALLTTAKMQATPDSGAIIVATAAGFAGSDIALIKTDSLGDIEWSRRFGDNNILELATTVVASPNGGYFVGGRKINPALPSHPGVIIRTDTFGVAIWALNVDFQTSDTVYVNDIVIGGDNNLIVSGNLLGPNTNFAFLMKINQNGGMVWKRRYKTSTRQFSFSNGLDVASNGGAVYLTSSDENGLSAGPYLIKTDDQGMTICDSIIDGQLIFPETISTDTLELTTTDVMDTTTVNVVDTLNYNFSLVTLELESFGPYCPDEVFSDTLDATVEGAIAYEWSTGDTTAMLVVTEFDNYKVTVTVGEDYCYLLCAETTISERPLPTINLSFNDDDFCSDGDVLIAAGVTNADMIVWEDGSMGPTIIVTQEDNYRVDVTNVCGTVSDSLDINFNTDPPEVTIVEDGDFCATEETMLTAVPTFGDGFIWSTTGDVTASTTVNALGEYTVTVTSNFCEDGTATYEVTPTQIEIETIADDGTLCADGDANLTVVVASGFVANSFQWSTGDMTASTTVLDNSTYIVTVTDFCSQATAEYNVPPTELTVTINEDISFCNTGEGELSFTVNGGDPTNEVLWSTGEMTPTIITNDNGEYSLMVSDFCSEAEASYSEANDIAVMILQNDTVSLCDAGSEILTTRVDNGVANTFAWSTGDNTSQIDATEKGVYEVTVTDFCGTATDSLTIFCEVNYDIGNIFTPNGDGTSDIFIPVFTFNPAELVEYKFSIYSRWGKKVFETTDPLEGWDGMVDDKIGVSDTYIYTVSGVDDLGTQLTNVDENKANSGDVTLIK